MKPEHETNAEGPRPGPEARENPSANHGPAPSGTLVRMIDCLRTRLKLVMRLCLVLLGLLVVIDAIPALVGKHEAHTAAEHLPGFWAAFGFLGCVVIILLSKAFGHAGIMQREDYYDE